MTTLYGIPNCDTVKKARAWLDRHGIAYDFHDYKKAGIDAATLKKWCAEFGYEKVLNQKGTTWRKLEDAELVRCWYAEDNWERRSRLVALAKEKGVTPPAIAAAYVLAQPFPAFALIGPRTLAETESSLECLGVSLTPAELAWLNLESATR